MANEWAADHFQIVWFTSKPISAKAADLFNGISDQPPLNEGTSNNPQIGATSTASGTFNDVELRIQVQPGRIDAFVTPLASAAEAGNPLRLDDIQTRLRYALKRTAAIADKVGPTHRLAVVAGLYRTFSTPLEANRFFCETVGIGSDISGDATDLNFSANLRKSARSGMGLNRLLRWEVGAFVTMSMTGSVPSMATSTPVVTAAVDVNTAPGTSTFTFEQSLSTFDEIAEELCNLAKSPTFAALMAG